MVINDSYFTDNNKSVFIYKSGHLNISDCSFYSNTNGLYAWEANGSVNNCSFVGNVNDYITKANSNLTVWDSYYSYVDGNVSWSYEEKELNYSGDDRFEMDAIRIGDVNGDGYNDIVVLNRSYVSPSVDNLNLTIYLYNTTTNEFDLPVNIPLYQGDDDTRSLDLENLDVDAECEIIVVYDNITVLDWDGSTWVYTAYSPFGDAYTHGDIDCGDVDDDGKVDIVTISEYADKAYVYLWDGVGCEFDLSHSLSVLDSPVSVFINDTNDDGLNDIVVKYDSGQYISMFNQTVAGFDPRYDMPFGSNVYCDELIIDDINNDGKNDVVAEVVYSGSDTGYRLAYRLWNSTSSEFDPVQHFAGDVIPLDDMQYFDCDADGEDEIVSAAYGTEIEVYNITDLKWEKENFFGDLQPLFYSLDHGILDDDVAIDMVCGGISGSILLWNGSTSNTTRNVRVEVRNDTDVGEAFALVTINDTYGTEVFNETTNETGVTPISRITLAEESLISEVRYGPFRMDVSKLVDGTWYNITRFLNITPFTGLYDVLIYLGNDTDNDGLTDGRETYVLESNASNSDTDGDSILDGTEDGINDTTKPSTTGVGFVADSDINTTTATTLNDTDTDGLLDGIEDADQDGYQDDGETDPNDWDSDDDSLPDGWIDFNSNGVKNLGEYEDYDLDGVQDAGPWGSGGETDPLDEDTDGGGMNDDEEIWACQDPLDSGDDGGTRGGERTRSGDGEDEDQETEEAVIGEVGTIALNKEWRVINLEREYVSPIVIASPVSWVNTSGIYPLVTYIRQVESTSFQMRIDTWSQQPEPDGYEVVNYMVMEEGEYILKDGTKLKAGKGKTVSTNQKKTFNLGNFFDSTPVVLTHAQTWFNDQAIPDPCYYDKSWLWETTFRPFVTRIVSLSQSSLTAEVASEIDLSYPYTKYEFYKVPEEIGYIAMDSGKGETTDLSYEVNSFSHSGYDFYKVSDDFTQTFEDTPVVFADLQTGNDIGTYYSRPVHLRGSTLNGNNWLRMEETTYDEGDPHCEEDIGWLAFNTTGLIKALITVGEVGTVNFADPNTNPEATVTLNRVYRNPVVIAKPFSFDSPTSNMYTPVHTRVTSVGKSSFNLKVERWWPEGNRYDNNRKISGTQVHYIVMEAGNYMLAKSGQKVEVGNIESTVAGAWQKLKFAKNWFDETPLVFMQSQNYPDENYPVVTRVNWATKEGITWWASSTRKLADHLQKDWYVEEYYKDSLNIGYIAIESGGNSFNDISYKFDKMDDVIDISEGNPSELDLSSLGAEEPLFIANMQEFTVSGWGYGGRDTTELRYCYPKNGDVNLVSEHYVTGMRGASKNNEIDNVAYLAFEGETDIYAWKNVQNPHRKYIDEDSDTCTIKGAVLDNTREVENQGVVGALVVIKETGEWREITDPKTGEFEFTGLEARSYTVKVSRANYIPCQMEVDFSVDDPTRSNKPMDHFVSVFFYIREGNWEAQISFCEGWWDDAPKYITKLKILTISSSAIDDTKSGESKKENTDELYVIADYVRFPHVESDNKYETGYHYQLPENEWVAPNEVICTRISSYNVAPNFCQIEVWEDDSDWSDNTDGSWETDEKYEISFTDNYGGWVPGFPNEDILQFYSLGNYLSYLRTGYTSILYQIHCSPNHDEGRYGQYIITLEASRQPYKSEVVFERPNAEISPYDTYQPEGDADGDGICNEDEYWINEWPEYYGIDYIMTGLTNPLEKDIFLEIDTMEDVSMPTEGIVKAATKYAEEGIRLHIDNGCLGGGEDNIDRGIGNFFRPEWGFENTPGGPFHYSRRSTFSYCFFQDTMEQDDPLYEQRDQANGVSLGEKSFCMPILDCTPQQVAYRLGRYLAIHSLPNIHSSDSDGDGLNDFVEEWYGSDINDVDSDGDKIEDGLEVELFKDPMNLDDVYGFDLSIAFYDDKNDEITIGGKSYKVEELIEKLEDKMKSASNLLLDLTDGYFYIKSITISDDGGGEGSDEYNNANIRVSDDFGGNVYQHVPYYTDTYEPLYVQLIYTEDMLLDSYEKLVCHELGHYLFWLGEEYKDSNGDVYEMIYHDWEDYEVERLLLDSIMCKGSQYDEFSTYLGYEGPNGWLNNRDSLARDKGINIYDTDQYDRYEESCWETIFRMCNRNDGHFRYVDFDLDHNGASDNEFYNNHRLHAGPTNYDIGQYLIINREY